jgi:hypothetical protein
MSDLESTRPGWILRAIGVGFILLANGLAAWDLQSLQPWWTAYINIITLVAGAWTFHLGTIRIRRAREHHEFMERHRQLTGTRRDLPGGAR